MQTTSVLDKKTKKRDSKVPKSLTKANSKYLKYLPEGKFSKSAVFTKKHELRKQPLNIQTFTASICIHAMTLYCAVAP